MYSTPAFLQASISSASIGLEASEIWVSPWQKAWKPSLVPAPPTSMRASGFSCRKSSAAAWVIGYTVLDPSMRISPETGSPPPPCCPLAPPQPARTSDSAITRPATTDQVVLLRPISLNPRTLRLWDTSLGTQLWPATMVGQASTPCVTRGLDPS